MLEESNAVLEEEAREIRKPHDLGGRRRQPDRRGRATAGGFPERRWLRHRRNGGDRRSFPFFASRAHNERRAAFRESDTDG